MIIAITSANESDSFHWIFFRRRCYELAGDTVAYLLATDWDIDQVWAVIKPFLKKYKKAKRVELNTLIGSHLSEKQLRSFLDLLKKEGKLKTEGSTNQTYYMLADETTD